MKAHLVTFTLTAVSCRRESSCIALIKPISNAGGIFKMRLTYICLAAVLISTPLRSAETHHAAASWQDTLRSRVSEYGHRNWIVIADSAYPIQTSSGIETIVSNADHFQVLQ